MKLSNLAFILILVCFGGCLKKDNFKLNPKYQLNEARFFDVPLPLNYEILNNFCGQNSYVFKTTISTSELICFYNQEMINEGWKIVTAFNDIEANLVFEKPHKFILISIRPNLIKKNSQVHIFVNLKEKAS